MEELIQGSPPPAMRLHHFIEIEPVLDFEALAEIMDAKIIDGSAIEIDESKLEPGQQWMERDFKPNGNGGFQRQV
jgi:hypothetical protein